MRFRLPQFAVYWAPGAADNYGKPTFAAPVEFACRWEDGQHETINADKEIVLSSATVFLENDVTPRGYLMLGRLADIDSNFPADASIRDDPRVHEIINANKIPSVRGTQSLREAHLE